MTGVRVEGEEAFEVEGDRPKAFFIFSRKGIAVVKSDCIPVAQSTIS